MDHLTDSQLVPQERLDKIGHLKLPLDFATPEKCIAITW